MAKGKRHERERKWWRSGGGQPEEERSVHVRMGVGEGEEEGKLAYAVYASSFPFSP